MKPSGLATSSGRMNFADLFDAVTGGEYAMAA